MLPQFHFTRVSNRFSLKSTPLDTGSVEGVLRDVLLL